jgi:hypothetical protein
MEKGQKQDTPVRETRGLADPLGGKKANKAGLIGRGI